jgi:hypothetical protein
MRMKTSYLYRILVSSYAMSTFAEGILMPIYAVFVQKIGGDILEASGAIAIFLIVNGLATIVIHRIGWSQKHRRTLMVWGWLIWVVGIGSYFIVSNAVTLFTTQVLIALGNAIADPAFDAELDDHIDTRLKSYEWGIFGASQDILNGIAAIAGGIIASVFGFKMLIVCMVFAATLSFALILYYVRIRKAARRLAST